jgi:hypothetical protein
MNTRTAFVLLALLLAPCLLHAQATGNTTLQPDIIVPFTLTAAGNFPAANVTNGPGDNRTKGVAAWTLRYQNTGMTAVTVTLQSGCSTSTTVTYGSFAGTISTGYVNGIVSDTGGSLQATNGTACISWVRVNVAATGTGTLTGVLYGFRNSSAAVNGGGGASPAGSFFPFGISSQAGGTGSVTANVPYLVAFDVPAPGLTLSATISIWTATNGGDAGHFSYAIYDSTKALVVNSQSATGTGNGTAKEYDLAWAGTVTLQPGQYWLAVASDSASTLMYSIADAIGISSHLGNATATGNNSMFGTCSNASVTASNVTTLPATCGTLTVLTSFSVYFIPPFVAMR